MADCAALVKSENSVSVCLYNMEPKIMTIGEKMEAICAEAYMNGYHWEVFFNYYLEKNAPDVLEEMVSDPEADMYAAAYPLAAENEARAEKFLQIIRSLIENGEEPYRVVKEGGAIEWD